ncbi:hypothetical protein EV195_11252 [Tenacibaculum skagerrakense]|uniref:Uncharacterized protein n=1 Tax=Tenacibaculum skagerrakense TaxID=186571 RepID=A0A4R2NLA2_9FLAO|nr:hypothetical protein [Tenacibaculum skagerrakense]TCP22403.1 hypothetical protein EV195_11252 [Tenacibaculum skagerrakense]
MKIKQEENGNIVITGANGDILYILPSMYVHQHKRKKNAILLNNSPSYGSELSGISILANNVNSVGDVHFNGDVKQLKELLSTQIAVSGIVSNKQEPLTKENDPNYVAYLQANTFEKLLAFVKANKSNIGGVTVRDGKIVEEEYLCQFETFIIRVTLNYIYRVDKPNLVNEVLMFGSTTYVLKPVKVYQYDVNDEIVEYQYREV